VTNIQQASARGSEWVFYLCGPLRAGHRGSVSFEMVLPLPD